MTTSISLFSTFSGSDAIRLADCIKAVADAGLSIDKHTNAGINQHSGNVWVWSEDWIGCVFCFYGAPQWQWTCPNCGEEYEFDTYAEMIVFVEDQQSKYEEFCQCCFE